MMNFKTDENIHPDVAALMNAVGHDVRSVWDEQLNGRPDPDVASAGKLESRALLTFDLGIADIRTYPPEAYAGLIVLRLAAQDRHRQLAVVARLLQLLNVEPLHGRLSIVDDDQIRIR